MRFTLVVVLLVFFGQLNAQRGHDGSKTVAGTEVVNEYTTLTADAVAGATTITVASNNLNTNARFSGPLAEGDLILIVQIQGASMNGILDPGFGDVGSPNDQTWGSIASLNNCGNWEFVEVTGVSGGSTIELRCGLQNNYTSAGVVQVVRVPRYSDLTVSGTVNADTWAGATGGICAFEVEGNTQINGTVDVTGQGFRGGQAAGNSGIDTNWDWYAGTGADKGGEKGESVVGDWAFYDSRGGRYARGAVGNGGGGGNSHNAGGAGGANASNGTYTWSGLGIPNFAGAWPTAWALEGVAPGSESSGGGRGGYCWSANAADPMTTAPSTAPWAGNNRNNRGGCGGRDLDYSTGKVFFGGGGGGGHENDVQGGDGGNGGGLVFLNCYGTITGSGSILANGSDGQGSDYTAAGIGQVTNKDGSGGGGGGGVIVISSPSNVTGVTLSVNGGAGGNQVLQFNASASDEAQGPGGGGGGGFIRTTGTTGTTTANGGIYGTTNAATMSTFDGNGATSGDAGLISAVPYTGSTLSVENDTICTGTTATLMATGSAEAGSTITWYDATWTQVGTGASYTTGVLTADAMYFYGSCPGTDYDTVWVIVGTGVVIDDTGVLISDASCAGATDGTITGITVSGGTLPYTYDWNGGPSTSIDTLGAAAGSYTLVITDAAGCTDNSGPHTIGSGPGVSLNTGAMVITDESCPGAGNGSITGITASGGTGPYIFDWNGGPSSGADTTGAAAGSYTLVVTDQAGCTATTGPHTIGTGPGISINTAAMVITDESCAGIGNGSITGITASGGTGPYIFDWNGGPSSGADTTGAAAGSYTLVVTDQAGCTATTGPHVIGSGPGVSINTGAMVITDESCAGVDGSITGITVSGGTGPYTFDWNGGPSSGADTTGAAAGSYTLVVTDQVGCTASSGPHVIGSASGLSLDVTGLTITDANCTAADGAITGIVASGGNPPYSFDWNGSTSSSEDTVGLAAGNYTLLVTDNLGCTISSGPHTVNSVNTLSIDSTAFDLADENCSASDGHVTGITVSGGTLPYSYTWNGVSTAGPDTVGLDAGNYTLVVTDAAGCIDSTGVYTVNTVSDLVIDTTGAVVSDENCTASDGSITGITYTSSGTVFSFTWNGAPSGSADLTGVPAGTYTLVITDDNGCVDSTGVYVVNSVNNMVIDSTAFVLTDANCTSNDGSISGITVSGGGVPYTYQWNGSVTSGPDTSGLAPGNYTLVISDNNGCIDSTGVYTINNVDNMVLDSTAYVITDANCGASDGGISGIIVSGPGTSYTYQWNGAVTPGIDLSGVPSGSYTLVVTDDNGCVDSTGVYNVGSISTLAIDTAGIVVTAENCGATDGSITGISVTGGTLPYTFNWNGSTSSLADTTGLSTGAYTLTVTDAAGCVEIMGPINVGTNSTLTLSDVGVAVTDENCGLANGTISGITASGAGTLTYEWNGVTTSGPDTSGLAAGSYTLVVTDANNCTDSLGPYVVNAVAGPTIDTTAMTVVPESCAGLDGSISGITGSGGSGPLTVDWDNGIANFDTFGISSGAYTLTLTDTAGCADSVTIVVGTVGFPTADFTFGPQPTDMDNPDITFTDASSSDVVQWDWFFDTIGTSTLQDPVYTFPAAGSYPVTLLVTNGSGCQDSITYTVIIDPADSLIIPNVITPGGNGHNDVFRVTGLSAGSYVAIFNRWGQKLFETNNYLNNWDGRTSSGDKVMDGTYYYIIREPDGTEHAGHLAVRGE